MLLCGSDNRTEVMQRDRHIVPLILKQLQEQTLVTVQEFFVLFFVKFSFFLMLLPIDYKQCHALTLKCPLRAHIWNSSQLVEYAGGL